MYRIVSKRYTKTTAIVVSFFLLVITGVVYISLAHASKDKALWQFTNDTKPTTGFISSQMNAYSTILYGVRAFFDASQSVEPDEWHDYVDALDLQQNYAGVTSLFYAPKVAPNKSMVPVHPATSDAYAYPITYLEPYDESRAKAIGFNVASESHRLRAMNESVRTNQPTGTPLILSAISNTPILSIYIPIYTKGRFASYEERKEHVQGFATVSFKSDEIFRYFITHAAMSEHIGLKVYDAASLFDASPSTLLFDSTDGADVHTTLLRTDTISVAGRQWLLVYSALPGYTAISAQAPTPIIVLIAGVLLSLLLPFFVYYRAQHALQGSQE